MNNMNPYEIRLDILKMAQVMVQEELQLKQSLYAQKIEKLGKKSNIEHLLLESPAMYTANAVISLANQFYGFVGTSSVGSTNNLNLARSLPTRDK